MREMREGETYRFDDVKDNLFTIDSYIFSDKLLQTKIEIMLAARQNMCPGAMYDDLTSRIMFYHRLLMNQRSVYSEPLEVIERYVFKPCDCIMLEGKIIIFDGTHRSKSAYDLDYPDFARFDLSNTVKFIVHDDESLRCTSLEDKAPYLITPIRSGLENLKKYINEEFLGKQGRQIWDIASLKDLYR